MKTNKSNKTYIFLGIIFVIILSCILLFKETSIPQDAFFTSGDVFSIVLSDKSDITDRITLTDKDERTETIKNILLDIKMRRTIDEKHTIHHTENPIVIYSTINHESWTFIFGKENSVYRPGIMGNYRIQNADEIIERIKSVINESLR